MFLFGDMRHKYFVLAVTSALVHAYMCTHRVCKTSTWLLASHHYMYVLVKLHVSGTVSITV